MQATWPVLKRYPAVVLERCCMFSCLVYGISIVFPFPSLVRLPKTASSRSGRRLVTGSETSKNQRQEPADGRADFFEVPYASAWHRHPVKEAFSRLSIEQRRAGCSYRRSSAGS